MEFKNLAEVTKLEEVPEGASVLAATAEGEVVRVPGDGLGGGGADWNAGEGEPGYIANKPFYAETSFEDVLDEIKITGNPYGSAYAAMQFIPYTVVSGEGYFEPGHVFVYDGVRYPVVDPIEMSGDFTWRFGNQSIYYEGTEDTGEPFLVTRTRSGDGMKYYWNIYMLDGDEHTFEIEKANTTYHKLAAEYVPASFIVSSSDGVNVDKSFAEIKAAFDADQYVALRTDGVDYRCVHADSYVISFTGIVPFIEQSTSITFATFDLVANGMLVKTTKNVTVA